MKFKWVPLCSFAALLAIGGPLLVAGSLMAQVPLLGPSNQFTPDQTQAALNSTILSINKYVSTCNATGCQWNSTLAAAPTVTGTCATAGGGTGFALTAGSNQLSGRITCATTASTTMIVTWATAKQSIDSCQIEPETVILTAAWNAHTAAGFSVAYASTASAIFDYICAGS